MQAQYAKFSKKDHMTGMEIGESRADTVQGLGIDFAIHHRFLSCNARIILTHYSTRLHQPSVTFHFGKLKFDDILRKCGLV